MTEIESILEEKKKWEEELKAMGETEGFDLIDENRKAYDKIVEELKKLENAQFIPHPEWSEEKKEKERKAYHARKEELLEEKVALVDLFEKQLQMNDAIPEQRRQAEMRVYSMEMRLSVLEKEKEKEHTVCEQYQEENKQAVRSAVGMLNQCKELLKKYQSSIEQVGEMERGHV